MTIGEELLHLFLAPLHEIKNAVEKFSKQGKQIAIKIISDEEV